MHASRSWCFQELLSHYMKTKFTSKAAPRVTSQAFHYFTIKTFFIPHTHRNSQVFTTTCQSFEKLEEIMTEYSIEHSKTFQSSSNTITKVLKLEGTTQLFSRVKINTKSTVFAKT